MSKTPIHAEDGSSLRAEPIKERPFTHPMPKPEVDNEGGEGGESERPMSERDRIIEEMASQADEDRRIPDGTRQEDMPMGEPVRVPERGDTLEGISSDDTLEGMEPGLQTQELMHEPEEEPGLPAEYADDPLAEFIVMADDEPMFRAKVNGEDKLIPLAKAHAELQKHEAADSRLQEASLWAKNLSEREAAIQAREAQVQESLRTMHNTPAAPSTDAQLDDETLETEARELVSGLFTGSEDEAAAKLADLLKRTKAPAAATETVDPNQIAAQAVAAARQQLSDEAREVDVKDGYQKFVEDYPEVAENDELFRFADSMTDAIAAEHPTWKPSRVMLEAGKRVRKWVKSQRGETSEQPSEPNDRQERKRQLRPVPRARQGTQTKEPEVQPESPADVLAEIKSARGQAV